MRKLAQQVVDGARYCREDMGPCEGCPLHQRCRVEGGNIAEMALRALEGLLEVMEPDWTPVTKGKPDMFRPVLVTTRTLLGQDGVYAGCRSGNKWHVPTSNPIGAKKVVAWKPWPKPYEGEV